MITFQGSEQAERLAHLHGRFTVAVASRAATGGTTEGRGVLVLRQRDVHELLVEDCLSLEIGSLGTDEAALITAVARGRHVTFLPGR